MLSQVRTEGNIRYRKRRISTNWSNTLQLYFCSMPVLYLDLEFGPYFTSILPPNIKDIAVVMSSPCDQTFSYTINGNRANYEGPEDFHEEKYEHLVVTANMTDFEETGNMYNGVPVSKEFCPWTLAVYPTQDFEDYFVTDKPMHFTLAILGVFLFTCFVFVFYGWLKERRVKDIKKVAAAYDDARQLNDPASWPVPGTDGSTSSSSALRAARVLDDYENNDNLWLADSGASTHMGKIQVGMFDVKEELTWIKIGDGKVLRSTKTGKLRCTVLQKDGSKHTIVLSPYKYVPRLWANMFSIMDSCANGWDISNEGRVLSLSKGDTRITFDRILKSSEGQLGAVEMVPITEVPNVNTVSGEPVGPS